MEIGRLKPTASRVLESLAADIDLAVCTLPFKIVAEQAQKRKVVKRIRLTAS